MRFSGVVLAVLVANIITIGLVVGAYALLKSDQGQMLLYELGLQSLVLAPMNSRHQKVPPQDFIQPRLSSMQPMRVTPRPSSEPPGRSSNPEEPNSEPDSGHSRSAIVSSLKMCRFWNAEYKKDGSSQSKAYRDQACKRYERFSGRDSSNVVSLASASSQPSRSRSEKQRMREERERAERRQADEKRKHEAYCDRIRERIDHYDSLLRAGGSAHYVNRLRGREGT